MTGGSWITHHFVYNFVESLEFFVIQPYDDLLDQEFQIHKIVNRLLMNPRELQGI